MKLKELNEGYDEHRLLVRKYDGTTFVLRADGRTSQEEATSAALRWGRLLTAEQMTGLLIELVAEYMI